MLPGTRGGRGGKRVPVRIAAVPTFKRPRVEEVPPPQPLQPPPPPPPSKEEVEAAQRAKKEAEEAERRRKAEEAKRRRNLRPRAPVRPRSSYTFFMAAKRGQVVEDNPELSFGQISRLLAKMWRETTLEERKVCCCRRSLCCC